MSNIIQYFEALNYSEAYTSNTLTFETRGNRTGVLQIECSALDSATLQSRVSEQFSWVNIVTVSGNNFVQEIVMAPYFRLVVSNSSGNPVKGAIHIYNKEA